MERIGLKFCESTHATTLRMAHDHNVLDAQSHDTEFKRRRCAVIIIIRRIGRHEIGHIAHHEEFAGAGIKPGTVYGKSDKTPFSEEDDVTYGPTTRSRWSYAASKAIDEYLALAYHAQRGLPAVVARRRHRCPPCKRSKLPGSASALRG